MRANTTIPLSAIGANAALRKIAPEGITYNLGTYDGGYLSGFLSAHAKDPITLRKVNNQQVTIPALQIERFLPVNSPSCPELLLKDMILRQVADLAEVLNSLK
ncbi:MAG: hypothetical protein M2R45_04745 [Verrucomicrobia subdivision 3 bacterium]|nr:hypothetical protein [Limisphaerales bacterium]MCS1415765.1 hypothetical protein [Limisphaerales bacterium]